MDLGGAWRFSIGDEKAWAMPLHDDSDWDVLRIPGAWEDQGFHGYDGYAWYRKKFDGKSLRQYHGIYLKAGRIDDADEVYVNGNLVGKTGSFPPFFLTAYNKERTYFIPTEYINFNEENVIAIRVYDSRLSGGVLSGDVGLYYQPNDFPNKINLEGVWEMHLNGHLRWTAAYYREWNPVMVPMNLAEIGITNYNRSFWYRKTFTIPSYLPAENLMLILGKIDDFDETYVNGKKVGETNDRKSFGNSDSWRRLRVYSIPKEYLNPNGLNEITVKVTDIGNDVGIYNGPIAIVPKDLLMHYIDTYWDRQR